MTVNPSTPGNSGGGGAVTAAPSADVLIALGAILVTPPDAQPDVWQKLATDEGGHVDGTVTTTVNAALQHVLDRLGNAGADQNVRNALVRTAKMLGGGP